MHWAINPAVQAIDHILGESACVGCVRITECSSAPQQAKSGERGREEQPSLMNYSQLLCTTPLSGQGRDGCMDGWINRRRANEGGVKVWRVFWKRKRALEMTREIRRWADIRGGTRALCTCYREQDAPWQICTHYPPPPVLCLHCSLSLSLAQTVQRGRLIGSSWMVRERAIEAQRHRLASGWCVCIMDTEIHLVSKGHASLIWGHTPSILTDFCCTHGKKTKALF